MKTDIHQFADACNPRFATGCFEPFPRVPDGRRANEDVREAEHIQPLHTCQPCHRKEKGIISHVIQAESSVGLWRDCHRERRLRSYREIFQNQTVERRHRIEGDHSTVEEMGLTNKSEGEQQLKPNNSDVPNEDQEEIQQPEEGSEHEEQAHSHPDVNCLHVGHLQRP